MRIKYIPQNEAAECGLACLAMLFSGYGYVTDLRHLRKKYPISSRGMTALDIVNVAQRSGFDFRVLRYSLEQLGDLEKPVILHWKNDHFVLFERKSKRGYRVYDPATGVVTLDQTEMSSGFSGIVIELEPGADFTPGKYVQKSRLADVYRVVREFREPAIALVLSSFFIELMLIAIPLVQQSIIDKSQTTTITPFLFAIIISTILIVKASCMFTHFALTRHILRSATTSMTLKLFDHLLKLPLSYFINRYPVDIFYRTKSIFFISQLLATGLTDIVLGLALSLVVVAIMFNYSVALTLLVLIGPILNIITRKYLNEPLIDLLKSSLYIFSWSQSTLIESVQGIESIKSAKKESLRLQKYTAQVSKYVRREHEYLTLQSKVVFLSGVYDGLGYLMVIVVGGYFVIQNSLTVGQFVAYIGFSTHFYFNINRFISKLFDMQMLRAHWDRILDIVHEETEGDKKSNDISSSNVRIKNIVLKNVSFTWGMNQPNILSNVSLDISENQKLAIIGDSGVGKSTLIKILSGQLYASTGEMLVNGVYCDKDNQSIYRNKISVLNQDDKLFSATILENITMFDPSPDWGKVYSSSNIAGLGSESNVLKNGYEYYINADNNHLCGGDTQRILIARALYQEPHVLVMDESTTFLGEESELTLMKRLINLPFTIIVVTHRRNFVELFDAVYHMTFSSEDSPGNQLSNYSREELKLMKTHQ